VDRPLRLISTDTIASTPIDALARTIEALLVVASQPLTGHELVEATEGDPERVETALALLRERYTEGRSGIVLERVSGGYAFRAAREAAEACGRLFERPIERGLSQAAVETLAIVAYVGPVSRPEIARVRGVAADSTVASLVERGLVAEAGRENAPGGAVRYRVTPLFERVFAIDGLAELPRLDDLGGEPDAIRERLLAVAEARAS
jgi:segregation and condensation protein B